METTRERLEEEINRIGSTRDEVEAIRAGLDPALEAHDVAYDRLDTAIHYLDMASRVITNALSHLPA